MSSEILKQKAHILIETADDDELLEAIGLLQKPVQSGYRYSDDEIKKFEEIAENYYSGKTKAYSWEEVKEKLVKK